MGTSREQRRVVVVGGGLAGLAATVWLAELGYAVTLVESNGSLGGRTIGLTSDHGDEQRTLGALPGRNRVADLPERACRHQQQREECGIAEVSREKNTVRIKEWSLRKLRVG